jgi:hypothetical protein
VEPLRKRLRREIGFCSKDAWSCACRARLIALRVRNFSSIDCLNLWESGAGLHPLDQGLLVLSAALPDISQETLADWPLGRRNMALAQVRCSSFGSRLHGCTACSRCDEKLEVEIDGELLATEVTNQGQASEEPIVVNGRSFRLMTTRDLAKAAQEADVRLASIRLAESCCLESTDSPIWSDEDLQQIGQRLALADPLAETRLALRCPVCENEWEESLDLVVFLWREIEARARRLLVQVHLLASAYGWSEADILSLSDRRRGLYLEMAQS